MLDLGRGVESPDLSAPSFGVSGPVAPGTVAGRGLCSLRRRTGRWTLVAGILPDEIRSGGRDGRGCP